MQRNVYLRFSNEMVDKPVITTLIRKYAIDVNIMEARITPNEEGSMFIQISGSEENLDKAFGYLVSTGVEVTVKPKRLVWHDEICVSCGACVGQCLPKALDVNPDTGKVEYDNDKCIACFLCVPACPYGAVEQAAE